MEQPGIRQLSYCDASTHSVVLPPSPSVQYASYWLETNMHLQGTAAVCMAGMTRAADPVLCLHVALLPFTTS
eukprot:1161352-Pelagomonas_calceolata.AAC.6